MKAFLENNGTALLEFRAFYYENQWNIHMGEQVTNSITATSLQR